MFIQLPNVGDDWLTSYVPGVTTIKEHRSPIDNSVVQRVCVQGRQYLDGYFDVQRESRRPTIKELKLLLTSLSEMLLDLRPALVEAIQLETGFIATDATELVDDTCRYLAGYLPPSTENLLPLQQTYLSNGRVRKTLLRPVPWGTVAVILPQNAFLLVAATCMANALATGNRAILRAPLQRARTALILETAVTETINLSNSIHFPMCRSLDFIDAVYASECPVLLHYMGSSDHASSLLIESFRHGKPAIVDGQGNGWCFVDENAPPDLAAELLCTGSMRFNGQTCTSINGAIIHPSIYEQVKDLLVQRVCSLKLGDPRDPSIDIGPLFSVSQAEHCVNSALQSGGKILTGGSSSGCYLEPTIVEKPLQDSELVTQGIFGNCIWIAPGTDADFGRLWQKNKYQLSASVISESDSPLAWATRLNNLARLSWNADPTIEDPFAPWGGYPASGVNPVSDFFTKYQRMVQIDIPGD